VDCRKRDVIMRQHLNTPVLIYRIKEHQEMTWPRR